MNLSLIQLCFVVVFGFSIARLFWLLANSTIPRGRGIIWILIWSSGLLLVILPDVSKRMAGVLGVSRGTDAVVYSAIAFLSLLVFRTFRLLDIQDRQISELTSALAIQEWERKKSDSTGEPLASEGEG